jgi:hypothetical protein
MVYIAKAERIGSERGSESWIRTVETRKWRGEEARSGAAGGSGGTEWTNIQ